VATAGAPQPTDSSIPDKMTELVPASLLTDLRRMIDSARAQAAAAVNAELTLLIGRLVVAFGMMCWAVSARATDNRSSRRSPGS
jgi:tetrahydromethanopterin S-methyltransferase subunit D